MPLFVPPLVAGVAWTILGSPRTGLFNAVLAWCGLDWRLNFYSMPGLIAGLVLMIAGVAMGVTVVMLPVGVPVGFFGLFVFLWGLFGRAEGAKGVVQPPNRQ